MGFLRLQAEEDVNYVSPERTRVHVSPDTGDDPTFRGYIESAPDAILVANHDTREIVTASQAAERFFGYSREALRSMDIIDLHPDDEKQRYKRLFVEHFENQPAVISQFDDGSSVLVVTADGTRVPVEINAWAIEDERLTRPCFKARSGISPNGFAAAGNCSVNGIDSRSLPASSRTISGPR